MKYQLETIPVTDAWASDVPCPLCTLMDRGEKRHVEYYLGNSVMNPETRIKVNETGFCSHHFPMMREAGHAHHLGLLAHTHLQAVRKKISGSLNSLEKSPAAKAVKFFASEVEELSGECLICRSMERDARRYAYTTVLLHSREAEFRDYFEASRGPCLSHAAELSLMALQALKKKDAAAFLSALARHTDKTLAILEKDILLFTQKFDAQNDNLEWGTSRDAHARTVQMLSGRVVRLED